MLLDTKLACFFDKVGNLHSLDFLEIVERKNVYLQQAGVNVENGFR